MHRCETVYSTGALKMVFEYPFSLRDMGGEPYPKQELRTKYSEMSHISKGVSKVSLGFRRK